MKKLLPYEVWRDINGFEGLYQIGARGNVKSLRRKWATGAKGTIIASHKDIIMKPPVLKNGYLNIILSKNGNKYGRTIHRLVAMAFINNPNHKKQVNHIDAKKTNNCVSNLEWVTQSENMKHAGKMGLLTFTEKRREFVIGITAKKVIDTTTGEIYPTISSAAKKLGKSRSTLRHWLNGKTKNRSSFILL